MADETTRALSHTELPPSTADGPVAAEWNAYRREIGQLLREGHEGRHVLVKGNVPGMP